MGGISENKKKKNTLISNQSISQASKQKSSINVPAQFIHFHSIGSNSIACVSPKETPS
jgi:hypothetical protein